MSATARASPTATSPARSTIRSRRRASATAAGSRSTPSARSRSSRRRTSRPRTPSASSRRSASDDVVEVGFGIDGAHALERFDLIGLEEMRKLADAGELQVVDVREPSEQTELAPDAVAVPYRLLADADLSALDPVRPTAVVCHTGARAPLAASLLAAARLHARAPGAGRGHGRLARSRGRRRHWLAPCRGALGGASMSDASR